ncbi:MAG: phosphodiester glycosidase family protein [Flavobacteriales bacterium]|nr:phosphodiester glycosidase family protein [Flavobacteriales bacterium]
MISRYFQPVAILGLSFLGHSSSMVEPDRSAARIVDPRKEPITFHLKNDSGAVFGNIGSLKGWMERRGKTVRFAMNGGMYMPDRSPVGLYIEDGRIIRKIDRRTEGSGNFLLQPNGVFGILDDGSAFVRRTADVTNMLHVRYATQSGPMLVVDGAVNKLFTPGSKNLNIRNGVGILADGRVLFGISRVPVSFHDFATWFKERGCRNALYLDGFVSRAFIPDEGVAEMDGELGVLIAVIVAE